MKNISFGYRFGPVKDSQSGPRKASEKQGGKCSEKPEWICFSYFSLAFSGGQFLLALYGANSFPFGFFTPFSSLFFTGLSRAFWGAQKGEKYFPCVFFTAFSSLVFTGLFGRIAGPPAWRPELFSIWLLCMPGIPISSDASALNEHPPRLSPRPQRNRKQHDANAMDRLGLQGMTRRLSCEVIGRAKNK